MEKKKVTEAEGDGEQTVTLKVPEMGDEWNPHPKLVADHKKAGKDLPDLRINKEEVKLKKLILLPYLEDPEEDERNPSPDAVYVKLAWTHGTKHLNQDKVRTLAGEGYIFAKQHTIPLRVFKKIETHLYSRGLIYSANSRIVYEEAEMAPEPITETYQPPPPILNPVPGMAPPLNAEPPADSPGKPRVNNGKRSPPPPPPR